MALFSKEYIEENGSPWDLWQDDGVTFDLKNIWVIRDTHEGRAEELRKTYLETQAAGETEKAREIMHLLKKCTARIMILSLIEDRNQMRKTA